MKHLKLTEIAPYSGKRVKPFIGMKRYMSTGGLKENGLNFAEIDFQTKPSRADIEVSEGDILFAKMKNTEKAILIDKELNRIIVSTGFSVHRPKENIIHDKYLLHYLKHNYFHRQKNKLCTGAIQSAISNKGIEKIIVPIPNYADQRHIAKILNKAENLITKRKESIRLLDEFLKSTFLEMFYSNSNSGNWSEVNFASLAENKKGSMRTGPFGSRLLHSEFTPTGAVRVLGIDNVVSNTFSWNRIRLITLEKFQEFKRYQVLPGDFLISIMATLGRTAVVPTGIPTTINSKHLAAVTLNKNKANPYFIAYAFHSHPMILRQLNVSVKGAIMDGLNLTIIKHIKFNIPPIKLQNKFAQIVNKTETLKTQYQQSLSELEILYGSLSQKAFTGKLTLSRKTETTFESETEHSIPQNKKGFAKLVLAGKIISLCKDSKEFTDIKFQKLQHLSEYLMEADLNLNYYHQAAGPYDNRFMHTLHGKMEKQKWFSTSWHKYNPMEKANEIDKHFSNYFGSNNKQFQKLIKLLGNASEDQCEIISTLYAVWNDKIIKGETITDEKTIDDFYKWSSRKKKYSDNQLLEALNWMRNKELEPKGFGELIKHKKR